MKNLGRILLLVVIIVVTYVAGSWRGQYVTQGRFRNLRQGDSLL